MTIEPGVGALAVRVAGLPASVLDGLRCGKAAARVEEMLTLDDWLRAEASALSDALHGSIGALTVPELKPRLVGLRRALHGGRRPPAHVFDDRVRDVLPDEIVGRIRRWEARRERRVGLDDLLRDDLEADVVAAAVALGEAVSSPPMLLGLVYSSPALFRDARRWLDRVRERPADRTAARLAKYVSRAAAKTSPLTLFTSSGIGSWRAGGPALAVPDPEPRSVAEVDVAVLTRVVGTLARHPVTAALMPVRVNPSAEVDGDVVRFIAPGKAGELRTLRLTPALSALLAHARGGHTLGQLHSGLAANAADPAHAGRLGEFIDGLVRLGLLEVQLPVADQGLDSRSVLAWLDALPEGAARADLRDALRELADHLHRYPASTDPERRLALREGIVAALSRLASAGPAGSATDAQTPGLAAAFYESAVLGGESVTADPRRWRAAMDDLAAVARFGELHDPGLPARAVLRRYVVERYGPCARVPFLRFYADYQAELAGEQREGATVTAADVDPARALSRALSSGATGHLAASPVPELADLGRLRAAASGLLVGPTTGVLDISPSDLRGAASGLRQSGGGTLACYVQPYLCDDEVHLVVNAIRFGLGTGRSRVRHLVGRAFGDDAVRRPDAVVDSADTLYVEIESAFGSALNQRDPAVGHVLAYPGTVSARPAQHQVALGELAVVDDPATGRVRLEWLRDGRAVMPVHLGLQAMAMLPPVLYFLVSTFGRSGYYFVPSLLTSLSPASEAPTAVRAWPRLRAGRVTFRRAAWWVPAADIPRRARGERDHAYLLRLARWRTDSGMPEQCFVRTLRGGWPSAAGDGERAGGDGERAGGDGERAGGDDPWAAFAPWLSKERKPLYIDFASWHLVQIFERVVADGGADLLLEEVLPALADAPRTRSGERRVVELLVEVPLEPATVEESR